MKIILKLFIALLLFVAATVYFAPASLVEKYLPNNISTVGVSGTILNGNVQNIIIDRIGLQNTKWTAKPLGLLLGKVNADVNIDSSNVKGELSTSYSGSDLIAEDIKLNGELTLLAPYFESYGLTINGQFDAQFDELHVKEGLPYNAVGTLNTQNTSILGIIPLNLGNVNSQFTEQAEGFLISLSNQDGQLDISGEINVSNNGVYNADITISRNSLTPDNVLQTIQLIGNKISEDAFKLQHQGQLRI